MASYAQIDSNNRVLQIFHGVPDISANNGHHYINKVIGLSGTWIRTDPWAKRGKQYTRVAYLSAATATNGAVLSAINIDHMSEPFSYVKYTTISATGLSGHRYNAAKPGYTYDPVRDAFIPPRLKYNTWILDETTCDWVPPVPLPADINQHVYKWDDVNVKWTYVLPISTAITHYLSGGKPGETKTYKF